jgi:hypothetical protein
MPKDSGLEILKSASIEYEDVLLKILNSLEPIELDPD